MRPPSYEGRDHVTMTTLSVTTDTLMFVGAEGGAGNGKKGGSHITRKMNATRILKEEKSFTSCFVNSTEMILVQTNPMTWAHSKDAFKAFSFSILTLSSIKIEAPPSFGGKQFTREKIKALDYFQHGQ